MNDETTPSESPEGYGNTVDGSRAGDGSSARAASAGQDPEPGSARTSGDERADRRRAEQKQVYHAPEPPDHALGGSEGTTDGS